MSDLGQVRGAILGALAAAQRPLSPIDLLQRLERASIPRLKARRNLEDLVRTGRVTEQQGLLAITPLGIDTFLEFHAALEAALGIAPNEEEYPSIPWLTAVKTCWIEALSINYAIEPTALAGMIPAPLKPEIHKDRAWVQVLISSLRDMRPIGLAALFGVCFYQVSYRAAVCYQEKDGTTRRGGFFVRSDTNHKVMRAIGNALTEFKFHDFGMAHIVMAREQDRLVVGVEPQPQFSGGKLVAIVNTKPRLEPPASSVWDSVDDLHEPLIECYDALAVDRDAGFLYALPIDRDPWNAHFVDAHELYCEFCDTAPLTSGIARMDSILHFENCRYSWRPVRRKLL